MKLNYKIIFHFLGLLLSFNGSFMLLASLMSFFYKDGVTFQIAVAGLIALTLGVLVMLITRSSSKEMGKREGYIVVTFGWLVMALSGTIPYLLTGSIPNFSNAFFETISGYTTTGSTILNDIEILPKGVLFWRSLTHWIGGMGIIVLAIAILPLLGIGGMQLFAAEAPGPSADKLHPRITDTAKRLWLIYFGYTAAETILLSLAGMSFFDAINHSMSTLSTGGFSTKNTSLAFWNEHPIIQYIVMMFMFLAGTNFVLSYFAFKGKVQKIFQDEEFNLYFRFILIFTFIAGVIIYLYTDTNISSVAHPMVWGLAESSFRHALFQVLAIVTTTGFVSADFTLWTPFLLVFFFGIMFLGGSSGSTSGGVKVVRHLLMIKNGFLEFKRTLHPNAILPVRYNKKAISEKIVFNVLAFFILYMLSFIIGALGFSMIGLDFESAIGVAASSLGNVGPALGDFGPTANFYSMPTIGKWWCSFLMLIGRLELFTVLILFTPFFWRNR
ncbi:TrkH family potassium uptake protein [Flavobacteriaceae bacterium]|jgi:trk system potassium uptake protein|nr:potassium transporter [Flavobacteriaceae bacterium]MCP4803649.1 TrkH family potassium uptake protein [Bacteroidota bacterium]MDA9552567.1 TrkH family potassium uptake protein [Flavobacteriaceae bacterium]MDB2471585.1 TrkH family potassium uptake protein [Flavobacteriaceae bacterium]MDB2612357.1 TrkH family potassium uptake protein [Flavobacteriaceae bacterium]